jgi:hypothetical protein
MLLEQSKIILAQTFHDGDFVFCEAVEFVDNLVYERIGGLYSSQERGEDHHALLVFALDAAQRFPPLHIYFT